MVHNTSQIGTKEDPLEKYLNAAEVCELVPGFTEHQLAQMRFRGDGPPFVKLSPRKVVYAESSLRTWLAGREQSSTREPVGA